jgi:hypothetical protein
MIASLSCLGVAGPKGPGACLPRLPHPLPAGRPGSRRRQGRRPVPARVLSAPVAVCTRATAARLGSQTSTADRRIFRWTPGGAPRPAPEARTWDRRSITVPRSLGPIPMASHRSPSLSRSDRACELHLGMPEKRGTSLCGTSLCGLVEASTTLRPGSRHRHHPAGQANAGAPEIPALPPLLGLTPQKRISVADGGV